MGLRSWISDQVDRGQEVAATVRGHRDTAIDRIQNVTPYGDWWRDRALEGNALKTNPGGDNLGNYARANRNRMGADWNDAWQNPNVRAVALATAAYFSGGAAGLTGGGLGAAVGAAGGAGYYAANDLPPLQGAIYGGLLGYSAGSMFGGAGSMGQAAYTTEEEEILRNMYGAGMGGSSAANVAGGGTQVMAGAGAGAGGMSGLAGKIMLGGSLYGLYQGQQMSKLARQQDPFSSQRAQYAQELAELSADPDRLKRRPGYQFGMDAGLKATQRALASGGYLGSGNEVIGMQDFGSRYAGTYLEREQNRLAGLAGANIQPSMEGHMAAQGMTNASLNNLVLWAMMQGQGG